MADVIATLKQLSRTDDEGFVCVCGECGTHYDASQRACPVCTEFSTEREAWHGDSESWSERPP